MAQHEPIDLTLDDEDEDEDDLIIHNSNIKSASSSLPPAQAQWQQLRPPPQLQELGAPRAPAPAPDARRGAADRVRDDISGSQLNGITEPPSKRQKTDSASLPDLDPDLVNAYCEYSLFPVIEGAFERRAPGLRQLQKDQLFLMVLNQVTGIDFENECVRTNYQPSKAFEANLHARIARLVERVLKDHPVRDCPMLSILTMPRLLLHSLTNVS